jgi:hypothetical protein
MNAPQLSIEALNRMYRVQLEGLAPRIPLQRAAWHAIANTL